MNLPSSLLLIAETSLGNHNFKKIMDNHYSLMMSLLDDLKSLIRNRVTTKSNDF